MRKLALPKFHDRKSLVTGFVTGLALAATGWTVVDDGRWIVVLFQVGVGAGLALHCFDMFRYYRKHRIVRIEKTDSHRVITKG